MGYVPIFKSEIGQSFLQTTKISWLRFNFIIKEFESFYRRIDLNTFFPNVLQWVFKALHVSWKFICSVNREICKTNRDIIFFGKSKCNPPTNFSYFWLRYDAIFRKDLSNIFQSNMMFWIIRFRKYVLRPLHRCLFTI